MDRILTNNIWSQVSKIIGKQANKIAAIAYISKGTPLSFSRGDTLVCDASDQAIKTGETDAKTLEKFLQAGAKLFSCRNLHAKLLVSGERTVIGSANLSASAEIHLVEASLISERTHIKSQAVALIHNIINASVPIDEGFIARISSIPVTRNASPIRLGREKAVQDIGNRFWIVNTHPMTLMREYEEQFIEQGEDEARSVAKAQEIDITWMRWTGKSRFRQLAKLGDTVIEIIRFKRKSLVVKPRPILFRQVHKEWTRFYLEDSADSETIPWTKFEAELKKVGLKKITRNSVRELNMREIFLMESIW